MNDMPIHPEDRQFTAAEVDDLNAYTLEIVDKIKRKYHDDDIIIVWDSHLDLQLRYRDICKKYPEIAGKDPILGAEWDCNNACHSGMVMYFHYAQMLFNSLCS